MVIQIIAAIMIGLLIVHYIYTNWQKIGLMWGYWHPQVESLPTVTGIEVTVVPDNVEIIVIGQETS